MDEYVIEITRREFLGKPPTPLNKPPFPGISPQVKDSFLRLPGDYPGGGDFFPPYF
uniref:Uncharacterized protein n=1 Tax=Peronospora matthiolae TaxID=2874970 RepID=A0AAV1TFT9_9STRA